MHESSSRIGTFYSLRLDSGIVKYLDVEFSPILCTYMTIYLPHSSLPTLINAPNHIRATIHETEVVSPNQRT